LLSLNRHGIIVTLAHSKAMEVQEGNGSPYDGLEESGYGFRNHLPFACLGHFRDGNRRTGAVGHRGISFEACGDTHRHRFGSTGVGCPFDR
jgi:hypothetical protein